MSAPLGGVSNHAMGTLNWTAPELLSMSELDDHETRQPDEACDIYAFAMVCYEASDRTHLPKFWYR